MPSRNVSANAILDAIPTPVFVVDDDLRIVDLNSAALAFVDLDKAQVLSRRGGEAFHCLHSYDVPEGCGRGPFCSDCVIRNSVNSAVAGQVVSRRRAKIVLKLDGAEKEMEMLVTASPVPGASARVAVLTIEDISEISRLKSIIPICSHCRRLRDDREYWQSVEAYFNSYIGVDFSHGICPECVREHYPEFQPKPND